MSRTLAQPVACMAFSNSSRRRSITRSTPASPAAASAHACGRPMRTAFAPNARAFKISVPRRIPPSMRISVRPPTASTIAGNISILAGMLSNRRPPWFETTMPSKPMDTAFSASSFRKTPLTKIGKLVIDRNQSKKSHVNAISHACALNASNFS